MPPVVMLIIAAVSVFTVFGLITLLSHIYTLNIKSRVVGDGQHGTARFATPREIRQTYAHVPFTPEQWRENGGAELPQGIVVGCTRKKGAVTALVDESDVHALMIGAAGVGKTAYWLLPNIEYACASGMSWINSDTKGVRPDRVQ